MFKPIVIFSCILLFFSCTQQKNERKPNFIIIFTDDQGYQDLGCYGSPNIKTPQIDKMAKEGMRFTNFYVQPICGPSRTALNTGCYPMRVAEVGNIKRNHPMVHPKEIMLSSLLKQAGYSTACIGKWDMNGHKAGFARDDIYPDNFGFDYWFGTGSGNDGGHIDLWRNREVVEKKAGMDLLVQKYHAEAINFIEQNKENPFFLYLAHTMPHTKLGASEAFKGKSERGLYGDVIGELDWSTGEILKAVKEYGLDKNTVVIFTSDNGPWLVRGENAGSAAPLRGGKVTTWEGGVRVPCVMWAPGLIPKGKTCNEITTSMDILPTFCVMAGVEIPNDRIIDGEDISSLITGEKERFDEERIYYYYFLTHLQAVRKGKWKLVLKRPQAPEWCGFLAHASKWKLHDVLEIPEHQLYDLENDIGETTDVAKTHPGEVKALLQLVENARNDIGDYNKIGEGARFFDDEPHRYDAKKWITGSN
ncbi:sulfatase family protein [Saccharicrinis sp. 156]|uniref:sulfatase family protein n=1 Tax=Saccharicrinis sp. 156 TaxID=3417574 RepID=UPI003D334F00